MPSKRLGAGFGKQGEGSHLGSKVHHCVHVVLSEQVADQIRALDVALDQLHEREPFRAIPGCLSCWQHLLNGGM